MKFLKFRYIFTLAIVLVLGITLMVYFLGGLNATALDNTNLEFTYEGYKDYSGYDVDGNRWEVYDTKEEMEAAIEGLHESEYIITSKDDPYIVQYMLKSARIVAQNSKYTMFLDEKTTVVTVIVNSSAEHTTKLTPDGFIDYKLTNDVIRYATANLSDNNEEAKSNMVVRYIGSNGKISSLPFNTFTNSVNYLDLITGQRQRHYKIKFNVENGIEILYEIGEFTVIKSFFPAKFDRVDFMNTFVGNMVFVVNAGSIIPQKELRYSNSAYTWSAECAAYLEDNELATVTPDYGNNPALDEEGNPIPRRYNISDILELNDDNSTRNVLKLKIGVDYNAKDVNAEGASPCVANPFANSFVYSQLIGNYYALQGRDENDETVSYSTDWRYDVANLSPTFILMATGTSQYSKLYDYMYKANTPGDPNYLYEQSETTRVTDANYEEMKKLYPTVNVGDRITEKIPVSYFEDLELVTKGYYNSRNGTFHSSSTFTDANKLVDDEKLEYMDLTTFRTYKFIDDEYVEVDRTVPIGGYQARDEDGNFLFDENGKPVQEVFSVERASIQNEKYNEVVEVSPPIFEIAMRFVLTDKGLQTTVLENSISEGLGKNHREDGKATKFSHDSKIYNIDVLPNFTSNSSETSEGQIIVPDGSGAIISFNSPKARLGYSAFAKRIYGADRAFTYEETQETQANKRMMFGMYGFLDKTNKKGVLAIADKGASQTSIYANFKRGTATSKNVAYFTALIRENEIVYVGSARTPFTKWSNEKSNTDFSYIYEFMDATEFVNNEGGIQYVTLARKYRDYLIAKHGLAYRDRTEDNVLALKFLGSFEKREVTLGFAHNVDYSLTTFEQAQRIIEELQTEGGAEFAVAYTAWTRDSMEPRATNNIKVSKVLGDAKGIRSFQQFLDENEINLYPEIRVTSNKGYDYNFGNIKYTSKGVGGAYSIHREYDLATRRASDTIAPITMLSPVYYVSYLNDLLKSYNKLGMNNAFLSDLGNLRSGDYARTRVTYPEAGLNYQLAALERGSQDLNSIMLSAPFDYAFGYTDFAVDVPLESSLLGYYDYSIPFYQLVVSGLFDYAGPAVNYDSEKNPNWYLLKALETGSNLQFILSAEDTKVLLNTDYTMFYNTYYANWKNEIIRMNSILNDVGIHDALLVGHKILRDNVYEVEYSSGLKLIINFTNSNYYDYKTGFSVRPNWFVVVEEAR